MIGDMTMEDHPVGIHWRKFSKVAPALCKGLRCGQSRKLILTPTKKGIKLEVKKESEDKP